MKGMRMVVAGDWHGNHMAARSAIRLAREIDARGVYQLGDFGIWPGWEGERYLEQVSEDAERWDVNVYFIDGNHEDFSQLDAQALSPYPVRERVIHLPRGWAWEEEGVRFLALGGATSLDKDHRVEGKSWWAQEEITWADVERAREVGERDVVLTHDCPSGVDIPGIGHRNYATGLRAGWSIKELERAWDHRDRLGEALENTHASHLWHGHFHTRYTGTWQERCTVQGLGDDSSGMRSNLMVAVIEDGQVHYQTPAQALYGQH